MEAFTVPMETPAASQLVDGPDSTAAALPAGVQLDDPHLKVRPACEGCTRLCLRAQGAGWRLWPWPALEPRKRSLLPGVCLHRLSCGATWTACSALLA